MLNVFTLASGRLFQEEIESSEALTHVSPVWVDLEAPTAEEKSWIEQRFGLSIPADIVDDDLEESARFYEEDNGELHIRSDFLIDGDTGEGARPARNVRVAFILFRNVLFSVHAEDLPVFRLLRLRARRIPALIEDAKDVLLKLFDADAEYSADVLEGVYDKLEQVSATVIKPDLDDRAAGEALGAIAREILVEPPRAHAHRRMVHEQQPRRGVRREFGGEFPSGTQSRALNQVMKRCRAELRAFSKNGRQQHCFVVAQAAAAWAAHCNFPPRVRGHATE